MKTIICLILDRSGSMAGRESDVIGGVNSFIDQQKSIPNPAAIAFVRFDSEAVERFRPMTNLAECQHLTKFDFQPRGSTPLLDAVGQTIMQMDHDWVEHNADRAIVVIVTDGEENASKEFTKEKIKDLIKKRQDSDKWAFIYLGANVDAFHEASALGIGLKNTAGYVNTSRGNKKMYETVGMSVSAMRGSGQMVANNLGGNIDEDGNLTFTQK